MSETLVDKLKRLLPALDTASHLARLNGSVEEAENFAKDAELMKEAIAMAEAAPRWIPVTERLPPSSEPMTRRDVWCYFPELERCAVGCHYDGDWKMIGSPSDWKVTHWAPLLDKPEC